MTSSRPVVVCSSDNGYVLPLTVMLHSLLSSLESEAGLQFWILDGGISDEGRQRIERVVEASGKDVDLRWAKPPSGSTGPVPISRWHTAAAYLRLLAPELLPADVTKVIYLDCDLIVLRNIADLWAESVDGYSALVAQDLGQPYISPSLNMTAGLFGIVKYESLGIAPEAPYFNSGVMVINLQWWRENDVMQKSFKYINDYFHYITCHDQDALNVVLHGTYRLMDIRWNQTPFVYSWDDWTETSIKHEIKDIADDIIDLPYIVHYASGTKPWKFNGTAPGGHLFFDHLNKVTAILSGRPSLSGRLSPTDAVGASAV